LFGSIPFGSNLLVGPIGNDITRQNTWAEHAVTRGKPVLQEIGSELDTQSFDFFFDETFCSPSAELVKLEAAFALKTPLPLVFGNGVYLGKRYVVDALDITVKKTGQTGRLVRVEATISLLESPVASLFGLITSIARGRAPAVQGRATSNPTIKR
jgi:phage protein U